jgi:hypothetical protein
MYKVLKFNRARVVALFLALLTAMPAVATLSPVQAKPPAHAPAWGYRAKHGDWGSGRDWKRKKWHRKSKKRAYYRYRDRRYRTYRRYTEFRLPADARRYRMRYRTQYDRYGRPHHVIYRIYY